jgi:hypothetical protein
VAPPRLHEYARAVLGAGLESQDPGTRQAASDLVNRLEAKGYLEFRDLLDQRE